MFSSKKKEKPVKKTGNDTSKTKTQKKKGVSTADSVPYVAAYSNGIIELKGGKFSKSYALPAINFAIVAGDEQVTIAQKYESFLSALGADVHVELTMYNKSLDMEKFEGQVFIRSRGDDLDEYRDEYNKILKDKMKGARNNLITQRILTLTVSAPDIVEADTRFRELDAFVSEQLSLITKEKDIPPMTIEERLEVLYSIYNQDVTAPLCQSRRINGHDVQSFSLESCIRQGITTKEVIAPDSMEFDYDKAMVGGWYYRTYCIASYPTWLKATVLTDIASIPANLLISVHMSAMTTADSMKFLKRQNVNISSEIHDAQKRASRGGYAAELISPDLNKKFETIQGLIEDVGSDDKRLYVVNFLITLMGKTPAELDTYEQQLNSAVAKNVMTTKVLRMQQEDALASSLPLGQCLVSNDRMMSSDSISAIIPWDVKEMRQNNGAYYGLNAVSHNLVLYNRLSDINPNSIILGMPGAGKSFTAKKEMINILLSTDDDVLVLDPEREYTPLAKAFDGAVVKIATGTHNYINPLDLDITPDSDADPVKVKADFITVICEIMVGGRYGLSPIQQSLISRAAMHVYDDYIRKLKEAGKTFDQELCPTLQDFYDALVADPSMEAQELAVSLERYTTGSLDIFSHHTNLDVDNRFVVFDIKDIGSGLKEAGLQICLDHIWGRMIKNFKAGKRTWIFLDEFHVLMQKETSAAYIASIWKRARKWGGAPCAITQNVEDMLKNEDARTVINNSSLITLLSQSPINADELSAMLDISPSEKKYITSSKPGMGLLRIKDDVIPIDDSFPKDTKLYRIMSTKPEERL